MVELTRAFSVESVSKLLSNDPPRKQANFVNEPKHICATNELEAISEADFQFEGGPTPKKPKK